MTIDLTEPLRSVIAARAEKRGMTPEAFVLDLLRWQLLPQPIEPRDEWERRFLAGGIDCGVSVPNEALSSEALYD